MIGSEKSKATTDDIDQNPTTIPSFGKSGVGLINALQLQRDGTILALLEAAPNNEVARYTPAIALDTSFGNNGIAVLNPPLGSMAQQANGQILFAGIASDLNGSFLGCRLLMPTGHVITRLGPVARASRAWATQVSTEVRPFLAQLNSDIIVCQTLEPVGRRQPFQVMLA